MKDSRTDQAGLSSPDGPGWDAQIAALLADLSQVQGDLLDLLSKKRERIAARDAAALKEMEPEETRLGERLMACHRQRQQLLQAAHSQGLPGDSLQALSASLPRAERESLKPEIEASRRRSRLLQHQSLTNWVLVQRTLLHLSQMIEIIATGGQMKPTYGDSPANAKGGFIVDQAG